jgi:hypothetical protein
MFSQKLNTDLLLQQQINTVYRYFQNNDLTMVLFAQPSGWFGSEGDFFTITIEL